MTYPVHVHITEKLEKQITLDNDMFAGSYVEAKVKSFINDWASSDIWVSVEYDIPLSRGVVIYLDEFEFEKLKQIQEVNNRRYRDVHEVATAIFFYLLEKDGENLKECLGDYVSLGDKSNYELAKEHREWYMKPELVEK